MSEHHVSFLTDEERAAAWQLEIVRHPSELPIWAQAAVHPGHLERLASGEFIAREDILDGFVRGPDVLVHAAVFSGNCERSFDAERGEDGIENMAAEVSECTATEVLPVTPDKGMVTRGILAHRSHAEPEIPVHMRGHFGTRSRSEAFVAFVTGDGDPGIHFFDFANRAFFDQAGAEAVFEVRVDLISHLGHDLGLRSFQTHLPRFPDGVGERLLAIDVLAQAHGINGHLCVHVVGNADVHGIKLVAQLGEHLAEVSEVRYAGMLGIDLVEAGAVDVAEADVLHVRMTTNVLDVAESHAVRAHGHDLEL